MLGHKKRLSGDAWKERKAEVIARDQWVCRICKRFISDQTEVWDVHHVVRRSKGGSDDLSNLILCHRKCHEAQHGEKQLKWSANERRD